MCLSKPKAPKPVAPPPPQYMVNLMTDNAGTRGFLDARAGRSILKINPGSTGTPAALLPPKLTMPEQPTSTTAAPTGSLFGRLAQAIRAKKGLAPLTGAGSASGIGDPNVWNREPV